MNFTLHIKSCTQLWPLFKNDPFSKFHISYQNSEIRWQKMDKFCWILTSKNYFKNTRLAFFVSLFLSFGNRYERNLSSFFIGGQSCVQALIWKHNKHKRKPQGSSEPQRTKGAPWVKEAKEGQGSPRGHKSRRTNICN